MAVDELEEMMGQLSDFALVRVTELSFPCHLFIPRGSVLEQVEENQLFQVYL